MNLVHKVGVIFHAQERVSRHLEKMAKGMFGLEKHYGKVNSLQAAMQAREGQVAKAHNQHMAARETAIRKYEASLGRMGKTQAKLSEMERKNQRAGQVLWDQYYAKIAGAETARTNLQIKQQSEREAANAKHLARMSAMDDKYEADRAKAVLASNKIIDGYTKQQAAAQSQRGKILRGLYGTDDPTKLAGKTGIMGTTDLVKSQGRQSNLRKLIQVQRDEAEKAGRKAIYKEDGTLRQTKDKKTGAMHDLTPVEQGRMMVAAGKQHDRVAGALEKQLAAEVKRVEAHHQLVALQQKELGLTNRIAAETTRQAAMLAAMDAEHLAAIEAISVAQRAAHSQMMAAQREHAASSARNDQLEIERTGQILAEKIRQHELIEQMKRDEMALQETAHTRMLAQIAREDAARLRSMDLEDRINRNRWRQGMLQEEYDIRDGHKQRIRGNMQAAGSFAAGRVASTGQNLMGGAMTLAMLGYLGNHLMHGPSEIEQVKTQIWQGSANHPEEAAKAVQEIERRQSALPGTQVRMSTAHQLQMLNDMISENIHPGEARMMIPAVGNMERIAKQRGRDVGTIGIDMAMSMERMGIMKASEISSFADDFVKAMATSKFMSPKALSDLVNKTSPAIRAGQMKFSMADYAFGLSLNPKQPTQVSTQMAGFLQALTRGGSNEAARLMLKHGGLLDMTKDMPMQDYKTGKPVLDKRGQPVMIRGVPTVKDMTPFEIMFKMVHGLDRYARFLLKLPSTGPLTAEQEKRLTATKAGAAQKAFPAMRGGQIFQMAMDPKQEQRYRVEQERFNAAPGMQEQLKQFDKQYNFGVENLVAAGAELAKTLGEVLGPSMRQAVKDATEWADATRKWLKTDDGKWWAETAFSAAQLAGKLMILNGAFLGLPSAFIAFTSGAVLSGLSAALASATMKVAAEGGLAAVFKQILVPGGAVGLVIAGGLAAAFAAYKWHEALLEDAKATSDLTAAEDRSNAARAAAAVARGEDPAALGIMRTPNANFPAPGGKIFDGKTLNLPKQSSVLPNFDGGAMPVTMTARNNGPQTVTHKHEVTVNVRGDGVAAEKAAKQIAPILTEQLRRAYQGGGKNVLPGTTPVPR